MFSNIKGIIYDFDGTIVDDAKLNEDAWIYASQKTNVKLTAEFFIYQRGVGNHDAVELLFDDPFSQDAEEFIKYKREYFLDNVSNIEILSDFLETKDLLKKKGYDVWICTASSQRFMNIYLERNLILKEFKEKCVTRDMTTLGKPNAEPLLKTTSLMNLLPNQCVYVGDAYTDYMAAENSKTNFIYYQQYESIKELQDYQYKIKSHKSIFEFLD